MCIYSISTFTEPEPVKVGLGSVFNIIEVAIAHIILFRFYEKTRFAAFDTLAEKNQLIKRLAETDKLTGLFNREKLDRTLSSLLKVRILVYTTRHRLF